MKQQKIVLLALILMCAPLKMLAKACVNPVNVVCPTISCNSNVIYISQADVGPGGIVLDTPNTRYCFTESIIWAPPVTMSRATPGPSSPIAAITITASNIELDLNGYTLQQSGAASYAVGIFVTNGTDISSVTDIGTPLNNIIIRNGNIQNIQTAGILVNKVNEFLLEDLYITNNGASGYILCPCTAHRAGGIVYVSFTGGQISAPFLNNHVWKNVHCDSNSGDFADPSGLYTLQGAGISAVDNILIENCTFNNNSNNAEAASVCFAIDLLTDTDVIVRNCQANGNNILSTEVGGQVQGFSFGLTNFTFENCQANQNVGGAAGGFGGGSAITNDLNGTFINCTANNNNATAGGSEGFNLSGNNALLINCQANSNSAPADCNGFLLFPNPSLSNWEFIDCTANYNTCGGILLHGNLTTGAKGWVIVYADEVIMRNCIAIGNTINGNPPNIGSVAYGIALQGVQNAKLDNCIASENYAYIPPLTNSAGFHLDGAFITLTNCLAEQNDGSLGSNQYEIINQIYANPYNVNILNCVAIGDPGQANSVGILLQNALNCIIEGNKIESNVQDGILLTGTCPDNAQNVIKHNQIIAPNPLSFTGYALTGIWAIEDNTAGASGPLNTYYDNYAWNYPGNVSGMTNYNTGVRQAGPVDPAYIWQWNLPGGPINYTGAFSKISNLDIVYGSC